MNFRENLKKHILHRFRLNGVLVDSDNFEFIEDSSQEIHLIEVFESLNFWNEEDYFQSTIEVLQKFQKENKKYCFFCLKMLIFICFIDLIVVELLCSIKSKNYAFIFSLAL